MDRRAFLVALGTAAATAPAAAAVDPSGPLNGRNLNSTELGLNATAASDQSKMLQRLLDDASDSNQQVFLPAGSYAVSGLKLPVRTRLAGIVVASAGAGLGVLGAILMGHSVSLANDAGGQPNLAAYRGERDTMMSYLGGGVGCLVATAWVAFTTPALRRYRRAA